jgi:hypothetical protein
MADGHCPRCDQRWTSAALHHCPACHLHFGSVDAFDRHRTGDWEHRSCIPEVDFSKPFGKAERPMLVRNDAGMWIRPPKVVEPQD